MNSPTRSSHALLILLIGLTMCASVAATITPPLALALACPNESLRNGPSEALPDCRAFEQVSPVVKDGSAAISPLPFIQFPAQSAPTGEAVVYMSNGPFPSASGSFFPDAHLSNRSNTGWLTSDVTPASLVATPSNGLSAGYVGYNFSEDLSQSVIKVLSPPRAPSGEQLYNLFLKRNGNSSLLNTAEPSEFAPEGEECYEFAECYELHNLTAFAGASSNFDTILFEANDSLVGTGAPGGFIENLYESSAGLLHLVGILPDGTIAPGGAQPGAGGTFPVITTSNASTRWFDVNHAISSDGTRIFWTAPATGALYVRENNSRSDAKTVLVAEGGKFWTASSNGADVFYTKAGGLYKFDLASNQTTLLAAEVLGVLGGSEDGKYIYFVANEQLVSGKGLSGEPNLYLWHEDAGTQVPELQFIATLAGGDGGDWTSTPANLRAYVTPNGLHVAFTSLKSLTGYDNHDLASSQPDSEIYEYSADTRTLACASCAPSGAPPVGGAFIGATREHLASTAFYQPRILSDNGMRLFFSSPDSLLPGDPLASTKIYEYEQPGAGSCEGEHGCLYRISSGSSGSSGMADIFLDADVTGSNIFFASASQLTHTDSDGLLDVYDARAGGGIPATSGSFSCSSSCSDEGVSSPPGSPAPGSQQVLGSKAAQPGKPTGPKTTKARTCQAKAKKLANRRARTRALNRCPKPRHGRTTHGRAR
jgi:hypothetical protein